MSHSCTKPRVKPLAIKTAAELAEDCRIAAAEYQDYADRAAARENHPVADHFRELARLRLARAADFDRVKS